MSLLLWATQAIQAAAPPGIERYVIARTLDRTFAGDTPASGGGNVPPDVFMRGDDTWQLYQVVPFLGVGVSPRTIGDCRIHIRDRSISRNQMELADMPDRVILSAAAGQTADWTDLPWIFTRPTANNKFTSPGSGSSARRSVDYEPERSIAGGVNASSLGIAQGETFTITLEWD